MLENLDDDACAQYNRAFSDLKKYLENYIKRSPDRKDSDECTEENCSSFDFLFEIIKYKSSKEDIGNEKTRKVVEKMLDYIIEGHFKHKYVAGRESLYKKKESIDYARCSFNQSQQFKYTVGLNTEQFTCFNYSILKFKNLLESEYLCMSQYPQFIHFLSGFWNKQEMAIENIIEKGNVRLGRIVGKEYSDLKKLKSKKEKAMKK